MPIELNGLSRAPASPSGEAPARPEPNRAPARDAGSRAAASADTVSLTVTAARLQHLEENLAALPVVDEQRVEAVRQAIAAGTYRVDADRVADKLLAFEQNLSSAK